MVSAFFLVLPQKVQADTGQSIEIYPATPRNFVASYADTSPSVTFAWNSVSGDRGLLIEYIPAAQVPGNQIASNCRTGNWKAFNTSKKQETINGNRITWVIPDARTSLSSPVYFRITKRTIFPFPSYLPQACTGKPVNHMGATGLGDRIVVNFVSDVSGADVTINDSTDFRPLCSRFTCISGSGKTPTKVTMEPHSTTTVVRFTLPDGRTASTKVDRFGTNGQEVRGTFTTESDLVTIEITSNPAGAKVLIDGHAPTSSQNQSDTTPLALKPKRDTVSPPQAHTLRLTKDGKTKDVVITFDKDTTITWDIAIDSVSNSAQDNPDIPPDPTQDSNTAGTTESCTRFLGIPIFTDLNLPRFVLCESNTLVQFMVGWIVKYVVNVPL